MAKRRKHVQKTNDRRPRGLLLIAIALSAAVIALMFMGSGKKSEPESGRETRSQSAPKRTADLPIAKRTSLGRPPWYPFKSRPQGTVKVPNGSVTMTQAEAKMFFLRYFEKYVDHILRDPNELQYVKKRMLEFVTHSRKHDPIRISAVPHYADSITVPASIGPSAAEPGKATLELYIPYWVEQDRHFVEAFVRDAFAMSVIHELQHFDTGFWKPDRDHSREVKVRDEAFVWGETCTHVILPMRHMGRAPVIQSLPQTICLEFKKLGSRWDSPAFIQVIATHAVN